MKDIGASSHVSTLFALGESIVWETLPTSGIVVAAVIDCANFDVSDVIVALSVQERDRAHAILDPVDRRHFVFRRCFQREFVKAVLNWEGASNALKIEHQLDTQPKCLDAPSLRLSFSSSGFSAAACASTQYNVGIDIEKLRPVENVVALAQRFFTPQEASFIEAAPKADQSIGFLKHWTAKEAGLKAIGKGVESGLNSFVLNPQGSSYLIDIVSEYELSSKWKLNYLEFPLHHIIAVVHNVENNFS